MGTVTYKRRKVAPDCGPDEVWPAWNIPESAIEAVRVACRLEDVAADYTQLRRSGRSLVGLCPLHSERTASFHVYPEDQHFKCYGCGACGDVFTFMRKIAGLTFPQVVRHLADRAGLEINSSTGADKVAGEQPRAGDIGKAAKRLEAIERQVLLGYRDELHHLGAVRCGAGERIQAIVAGAPERWLGEGQHALETLLSVNVQVHRLEAAYYIVAFGSAAERARFALRPGDREVMIDEALASGQAGNANAIKAADGGVHGLLREHPELIEEINRACVEVDPWPSEEEADEICRGAYSHE